MAYNFPEKEKDILKFWAENKIFEKLRKKNAGKSKWSFLDGPITANNPMGVHHAWGRTYKDLFQRYKAMQGFDQRYQNGFDCQGLWVEVEVEKELGFKNKKDIEVYGIDKFVEKCKERVKKYSAIQTQQSIRLGQWMDWENSYYTMSDENNYAIWKFLKVCYEKGLIYKGHDSVPWCPRCETAISQHEILTEDYKELVHESIIMKLPIDGRNNEYLLVWTTTPWTIPANVAVAGGEKIDYSLVKEKGAEDKFWVADALVKNVFTGKDIEIIKTEKGKALEGLHYKTIFDNLPLVEVAKKENPEKFHSVVLADPMIMPISIEEGTGMVHTAPGAGAEDFNLGKKLGLPVIAVIADNADYLDGLGQFSGKNAKKHPEVILDHFKANLDFVFSIFPYKHRYPACWRCKTELVWKVADEWYVSMDKLRKPLVAAVKKINWIPEFGLDRELDWLKNMHDWLISKKNRYWGLALPIFECKKCNNFEVIGSKEELKKRAVEVPGSSGSWDKFEGHSPHKPFIDEVKIKCKKCGEVVSRIKDVGNPWLDAGIVPFSTMSKDWFPAELVCESFPGQFKNWFYSIIVMSVVLSGKAPAKTIFGYASVKDEKGEEMHKSKGNAIWFDEAVEKIGADPMRWLYAKQNPAENLGFGYNVAEETRRKLMTLYNSYVFFSTYVKKEELSDKLLKTKTENVLDGWIVSRVNSLICSSELNLDKYDVAKFTANIEDFFINDFSLWYIRRSRKRFNDDNQERAEAIACFYYVLLSLTKIMAPVMPFFAEEMYQGLKTEGMPESVHLCDWPRSDKKKINKDLEEKMDEVRAIVNLALAERTALGIKVKQPLSSLKIKNKELRINNSDNLLDLIKDEVNVKEIIFAPSAGSGQAEKEVELDTNITEELKEEGTLREIIRSVQAQRKEQNLVPQDKVVIELFAPKKEKLIIEKNKELLLKECRATEISVIEQKDGDQTTETKGAKYLVKIVRAE